jgi:MFS family permease
MATIALSNIWFPPSQRTVAISAQSFAFIIGGILGFAIGPIFVNGDATVGDI